MKKIDGSISKYWIYLVFSYIFTIQATASTFMPSVTNHSAMNYGAGYQNWACTQDDSGRMYFGNAEGLLTYDGCRWKLYEVPGSQAVRSVYAKGNRIYIGSFKEFGYFESSETGIFEYHSLDDLLNNFSLDNYEIWNILEWNDQIYFQSFNSYFTYNGELVQGFYNEDYLPLYFYTQNGRFYVQMINDGFYEFDGRNFRLLFARNEINNDDVVALLPHTDDSFILVTEDNGLFCFNGRTTKPWQTDIDHELKNQRVNRAVMTRDSVFMIGTILNGIYAIDRNGHCLYRFNVNNRLENNTVLNLYCDKQNNVWAALDHGIAHIHYNSPLTYLTPDNYQVKPGMVYDIAHKGNFFYLATNQGVYEYSQTTHNLRLLPNSEGQNWFVKNIDGQYFVGNNSCTLLIQDGGNIQKVDNTTSSTSIIKCILYNKEILLEASYSKLRIYRKENDKWSFSHNIEAFEAPIRHIEVDRDGIIWASHMYQGMYKIILNNDLTTIKSVEHITYLGSEQIVGPLEVMKICDRVVFFHRDSFYVYDDITLRIVPYEKINSVLPYIKNVHSVKAVTNDLFWLSGLYGHILVNYRDGEYYVERLIPTELFDSPGIAKYNNAYVGHDTVYFNLNNGMARYCNNIQTTSSDFVSKLSIESVVCASSEQKERYLPLSGHSTVESSFQNFRFRVSLPHYDNLSINYHYTLTGNGVAQTAELKEPEITYSKLNYGHYEFRVEAYTNLGQKIDEAVYEFTIEPPFYLTFYAIALYCILCIGSIYYIFRKETNRALERKRKEYEEEQIRQNIKMHEQEHLIAMQQQKLLEAELSLKSKDLASMALGVYAKNEALEKLRTTIQDFLAKGEYEKKNFEILLRLINENIETQEFWDVFQQNFDLIHEKFFRHLRERYPNLTATDLRFCALLRLNLSTKDIAHMTNLTIRGVETARYRLRKKLEIPKNIDLVDFFIDMK